MGCDGETHHQKTPPADCAAGRQPPGVRSQNWPPEWSVWSGIVKERGMIFALAFFAAIPISGFISVAFLIYREKQGWGWLLFAAIIIAGSIHMKAGINHERTRNDF
jgi:hypothetical protein